MTSQLNMLETGAKRKKKQVVYKRTDLILEVLGKSIM